MYFVVPVVVKLCAGIQQLFFFLCFGYSGVKPCPVCFVVITTAMATGVPAFAVFTWTAHLVTSLMLTSILATSSCAYCLYVDVWTT